MLRNRNNGSCKSFFVNKENSFDRFFVIFTSTSPGGYVLAGVPKNGSNTPLLNVKQNGGHMQIKAALYILAISMFFVSMQPLTEKEQQNIDQKVKSFLDSRKSQWDDMNVPEADGQVLYDLIIKNNYKSALEIGTSTGRSAIWIAWALSKTGGKLITIEINERRYKEALENFKQAGVSDYIDARLADAHQLVKELDGPFDFVFSDADKDWYTNYFKDIFPKLKIGGCFTAHNVSNTELYGIRDFLNHLDSLKNVETTINHASRSGISISYKRSE
jgi:caffeoyl-CoA O-methyltransferase